MRICTSFATAAALLALTGLPGPAAAQVCAGFPTIDGQASLALLGTFPREADQFGAEGSVNLGGPAAVFGGFTRTTAHGAESENANTYSAGLALDVAQWFTGAFPLGLSACPVASASLTELRGAEVWRVPVGVGIGGQVVLGPPGTLELMPYVVPQLVWTRIDFTDPQSGGLLPGLFGPPDTLEDVEETQVGLRGGVLLGAGRFYFGGEATEVFGDDVSPVLGVKAGVRF